MRVFTLVFVVAALFLTMSTPCVDAAETYGFQTVVEGSYHSHRSGTVIIDGEHWRINYDAVPDASDVCNAVIGRENGDTIAINDASHTWFHLGPAQLGIDTVLFGFGDVSNVSRIRVEVLPPRLAGGHDAVGAPIRISFSYSIDARIRADTVKGKVWGEVRLWATPGRERANLPWRAMDLRTGLGEVDKALQIPLGDIHGFIWQSETEVSRRLEGGEVLKQVIRRTIGPFTQIAVRLGEFSVPEGYGYQEPVLAAPSQ